jgi:hypothetical protein
MKVDERKAREGSENVRRREEKGARREASFVEVKFDGQ